MFRSSLQPIWDLTIHPLRANILTSTHFLLQSIWDPPIQTPLEPSILAGTPPRVHPLWDSASLLEHRSVSTLIPFVTAQSTASRYCPLWTFLFGLSLKIFKTRLLKRGFHTLIKNVSFSSPTDAGSHNYGGVKCVIKAPKA